MSKNIHTYIDAELANAVSRHLLLDWEDIVKSFLGKDDCQLIKKPSLQFVRDVPYLGCFVYDAVPTISINEELVLEHSWCALESVFYHEVAHQLAAFMYPHGGIAPHGPEFRDICRQIGARWEASVDIESLDSVMSGPAGALSPVAERLRKLLAMAGRGEANEAQVALSKARELMARHGLTEADADGSSDYVTVQVGTYVKRMNLHTKICSNILEEHWGVQCVVLSHPDPVMPYSNVFIMTVSGPREKVAVASYVYDCIMRGMENAYNRNRNDMGGAGARRSFCLGYLEGISRKLAKDDGDGAMRALIHKGDAGTLEYLHNRFPRLRTRNHKECTVNGDAHDRGIAEGRKLDIRSGVGRGRCNNLLTE